MSVFIVMDVSLGIMVKTISRSLQSILCKPVSVSVLVTSMLVADSSWATQFYRYKDDNGKTVLGLTIPPEFVPKGYDILSPSGRVIERVAPALTPEQIRERDLQIERDRLAQIEQEKQDAYDAQLKQWYGEPDTAVRVLKRRATDIINVVQVEVGKIFRLKKEIEAEQSNAADLQRRGAKVPDSIPQKIARLESEIANSKASIAERRDNYQGVLTEFDEIIRRLEIISNSESETYTTVLETLNASMDKLRNEEQNL